MPLSVSVSCPVAAASLEQLLCVGGVKHHRAASLSNGARGIGRWGQRVRSEVWRAA